MSVFGVILVGVFPHSCCANKNWFQEIKGEITKNQESSEKVLRLRKFKKFNILKCKPTVPSHTNSQEDDATQDRPRKLLYSDIIKCKPSESWINKKSKTSSTN